jgi:hypothetical protein
MTIAIELTIGGELRTVRGVIVESAVSQSDTLHVALEDPDGTEGAPILMIPQPLLEQDERFGCDFFLRLPSDPDFA